MQRFSKIFSGGFALRGTTAATAILLLGLGRRRHCGPVNSIGWYASFPVRPA